MTDEQLYEAVETLDKTIRRLDMTVDTGLTFKGHPVLLGPHVGRSGVGPEYNPMGKRATTLTLTLLDRFLKKHLLPTFSETMQRWYLKECAGVMVRGAKI